MQSVWQRVLLIFVPQPLPQPPSPPPPDPEPAPLVAVEPPAPAPEPEPLKATKRRFRVRGHRPARVADVWAPGNKPKRERKAAEPARLPRSPRRATKTTEVAEADGRGFNFGREDVEEAGAFYFRGALLNDLPKYFRSLRRLRGADPDVYHLCSTIGMSLLPARMIGILCDMPAYWRDPKLRPAFGAASFAEHGKEDNLLRLVYFQRMEIPPADVEPTNGQIYQVSVYYDDDNTESQKKHRAPKWMRKHGFAAHFFVSVDDQCRVTLLKQFQIRHQMIHFRAGQHSASNRGPNSHTNGNHTRKLKFSEAIPIKLWDYPVFLHDAYRDRHGGKAGTNEEIAHFEERMFCLIASFANANEMGVRVSITARDGLVASFALDMKRSAYFFKDRDQVLTAEGKAARIFHVVRPHTRHLKNGKSIDLRMHFRGLRKFPWAGYEVHITVPGLHHLPVLELMPDVSDLHSARLLGRDGNMTTTKVFGKELHDYLDRA
jgi:hypothetical protein